MLTATKTPAPVISPITIQAQYIKDLSFENPTPLSSFTSESNVQPGISVGIEAKAQAIGGQNFEVVLDIHIQANREKVQLFTAKLSYAGIVTLSDSVDEGDAALLLRIEGPRLLFPFARNILADVTRDGGFPPLMLAPVDFVALYEQQKDQKIQATEENGKKEGKFSKVNKKLALLNGTTNKVKVAKRIGG
jgi:preprotein translocase subunit SecB